MRTLGHMSLLLQGPTFGLRRRETEQSPQLVFAMN